MRIEKIHNLKTWPAFFQAVKAGIKKFDYRKNDRGVKVGDGLCLQEYDPETKTYTGETLTVLVSYMITDVPGLPKGYCVMGIVPL